MKVEREMFMEREACTAGHGCSRIDTTYSKGRSPFVKELEGESDVEVQTRKADLALRCSADQGAVRDVFHVN